MATTLGPWPVSGPAIEIGSQALADDHWNRDATQWLAAASRRLTGLLQGAGLEVIGSTPLFALATHSNALELHAALAHRGILCRAFDYAPDWLRFGLPGSDADEQRLAEALQNAVTEAASASAGPSQVNAGR